MSSKAIRDEDSGVTYEPHTGPNGERGFRCTHDDGREVFITLNPSGGSDDGVPNVFVYIGPEGDASIDGAAHHYVLDDLLSTEAKVRQAFEEALQVKCTPHSVAPPRPGGTTMGRIARGMARFHETQAERAYAERVRAIVDPIARPQQHEDIRTLGAYLDRIAPDIAEPTTGLFRGERE